MTAAVKVAAGAAAMRQTDHIPPKRKDARHGVRVAEGVAVF